MFLKLKKKEKTDLDREIEERIKNLSMTKGDPEEDEKATENLERLTGIKEKLEMPKNPVNPNTIIAGVFTLVTALAMLNYEKTDVITSKVLGVLPKFRF